MADIYIARGNQVGMRGIKGMEGEVKMVNRGQIITELVHRVKEAELLSFKPVCLKFSIKVP